ncbi:MAG: acetyl-CoA carboxylase biotin carboxylase subunit family protein [Candidatus Promineifilaceae bacterium]
MSANGSPTILCLASEFKGLPFIIEAKKLGSRIILLAQERDAGEPWPFDSVDTFFTMPDLFTQPNITYAVSYLARENQIDRIVALDDFDVATAAALREHMRLPGLSESIARHFRDKLAMRVRARAAGINVPEFTAVFNYDQLRAFMDRVAPPWILKPRFSAGAIGIQKLYESEQLWRTLDRLGDQQSYYVLEQFLPGEVYHVDSVIYDGAPLFARASKYGETPLAVTQGGGIFSTRTLDISSPEQETLQAMNREIMAALGHRYGVSHTEFIRAYDDGRFYFLETAARVAGANIDKMVAAASGIDLWTEAARIEVAGIRGESYQLPTYRDDSAGLVICLARQEHPDMSAYQDPEIIWRLEKPHHAGLLVASPDAARVQALTESYSQRFANDFLHHIPGKEKEARNTI